MRIYRLSYGALFDSNLLISYLPNEVIFTKLVPCIKTHKIAYIPTQFLGPKTTNEILIIINEEQQK